MTQPAAYLSGESIVTYVKSNTMKFWTQRSYSEMPFVVDFLVFGFKFSKEIPHLKFAHKFGRFQIWLMILKRVPN